MPQVRGELLPYAVFNPQIPRKSRNQHRRLLRRRARRRRPRKRFVVPARIKRLSGRKVAVDGRRTLLGLDATWFGD